MKTDDMLKEISANGEASKKLDKLFDLKLNGFPTPYTVDEIIESVYNKYCKEA